MRWRAADPDGLEVLRLVAAGLSSQEIGDRLARNVRSKPGQPWRGAAAAAANPSGPI